MNACAGSSPQRTREEKERQAKKLAELRQTLEAQERATQQLGLSDDAAVGSDPSSLEDGVDAPGAEDPVRDCCETACLTVCFTAHAAVPQTRGQERSASRRHLGVCFTY